MTGLAVTGMASTMAMSIATAESADWRGRACIISVNPSCAPKGWSVGDCAKARLRLPNVLGNGNNTSFSMVWSNYAQNFWAAGDLRGTTYQSVTFSFVGSSGGTNPDANTTMRIPLVQPVNLSQPWVHAVIDIFRVDDFSPSEPSLCLARYRFTGMRYPDGTPLSAPGEEPSGFSNSGSGFAAD